MSNVSESLRLRWASISPEERSKIMSERRKKGVKNQTPEQRKALATHASNVRWGNVKNVTVEVEAIRMGVKVPD